ncbi:CAP domain-containing protein [Bacillus sp. FJAT-27445]|uniref:CAP domain-containing protein n=1 Tax=Bacillus sp. FJAT-27445 TaxID=1679166 RepID=UPI00074332DC|nr:CAP domain-containing protein [Bacillus sp. FJAT-27445]
MDSDQYPNTQAILIEPARYEFIRVDGQGQAMQQYSGMGQYWQDWQISFPQNSGAQPPVMQPGQIPNQYGQAPAPQQGLTGYPQQGNRAPQQAPAQKQTAPKAGISKAAQQVIDLTNVQRQQNGLPPLKADAKLSGVALKKSQDMQQKNYFSHTSPTYGSPFDMMRDFGVSYRSAGENIAMGQRTPQEVVQAWMNSEGHRNNILNREFTHIGVGFEQGSNHWTQMFIGK